MNRAKKTIIWLQSAGCGGCTMSMLCAENPGMFGILDDFGLEMLWRPALSEATGEEAAALLGDIARGRRKLDILCFEGSAVRGPNGTGRYHMLAGTGRAMIDWLRELAGLAGHVVAVGACAAFGGVTSAGSNISDACGLQYDGYVEGGALGSAFQSRSGLPVINVAGCPSMPRLITSCSRPAISDPDRNLGTADFSGVRRDVDLTCVATGDLNEVVGKWVLVHAGFAMSIIDEDEARLTLAALAELGEVKEEIEAMRKSAATVEGRA